MGDIDRESYDDALKKLKDRTYVRLNKPADLLVENINWICELVFIAALRVVDTKEPNFNFKEELAGNLAFTALKEWPVERYISWTFKLTDLSELQHQKFPKELSEFWLKEIEIYNRTKEG